MTDYAYGISAIDSGYLRPRFDAVYLLVEGERAAIIDSGVNASVPRILDALQAKGIGPDQVDSLILTHVHLDHAGGAGLLLSYLPHARVAVHPRGARHIADPTQLVAGATAVYGAEAMRALYGEIMPVPTARIIEMPHLSSLDLNGRGLTFFDTPGHARHHLCIRDDRSGCVFTGDTFGLSYRELDHDGRQFVFPTTTPVQFDPDAAHSSLDLITGLRPAAAYVTHFGEVRDIPRLAADMHRLIDAHVTLARAAARTESEDRHLQLRHGLEQLVCDEAQRQGWQLTPAELIALFSKDIELNAQGLAVWLERGARG